jgi:hypothetical protein
MAAWVLAACLTTHSLAVAEQPSASMSELASSPFQVEVTILSVETRQQTSQITNVWHRVRIERVMAGEGLEPGDETAVVSQVRENTSGVPVPGSSGDRGPFKGPNGLPLKGDRARLFAGGSTGILKTRSPNGWQETRRSVAFVAADEASRADESMSMLARLVSEAGVAAASMHLAADDDGRGSPGMPDVAGTTSLTDHHGLNFADGVVLCMQGCTLDSNPLRDFHEATHANLPLVGFGPSTRAFAYPAGPVAERWNERFARERFGTITTASDRSAKVRILPPDEQAASHPVLKGVAIPAAGIVAPGPLERVDGLASDCRVLLWGVPADGDPAASGPIREPILWVRELPREHGLPSHRLHDAEPAGRLRQCRGATGSGPDDRVGHGRGISPER